ncbi:MAG: hypothetical protein M3439_13420 [Chloroflexota bacterium]|nr:hypothetical protein [Chloroflexota bacterium]
MRVRYRDHDDIDELGRAGYLRIGRIAGRSGYAGALLTVNARGEPLEFTWNTIATPQSALWRAVDLRRNAVKLLAASLLTAIVTPPDMLLCPARQSMDDLFRLDIEPTIPICLVPGAADVGDDGAQSRDTGTALVWIPSPPPAASPQHALLDALERRGLLLEPFERAGAGLREVYAGSEAGAP